MFTLVRRFIDCRRGGLALLFALVLPVLLVLAGGAIDFSRSVLLKREIKAAADGAVLAAANEGRLALLNGNAQSEAELLALVEQAIEARFAAKLGDTLSRHVTTSTPSVAIQGTEILTEISYSASRSNSFLPLVGIDAMEIQSNSHAAVSIPQYYHITFVFDISQSMAIGATSADRQTLDDNFGCAFACHISSYDFPNESYGPARGLGVDMQIDIAREAALDLIDDIEYATQFNGQFSFSLYTYDNRSYEIIGPGDPFRTDLDYLRTKISQKVVPNTEYGGTDTYNTLRSIADDLPPSGSGVTPDNPVQFLVVLTDGIENDIQYNVKSSNWEWDLGAVKNNPTDHGLWVLDPDDGCGGLQNKNVNIYAIVIERITPTVGSYTQQHKDYFDYIESALMGIIPKRYESCVGATFGRLMVTNSVTEVEDAFDDIFAAITTPLRLN